MSGAPAARNDSVAEADNTARWQAAKQHRQHYPGWIVIAQIGQYGDYHKSRAPRDSTNCPATRTAPQTAHGQVERSISGIELPGVQHERAVTWRICDRSARPLA